MKNNLAYFRNLMWVDNLALLQSFGCVLARAILQTRLENGQVVSLG
jgi:hypothetical protein